MKKIKQKFFDLLLLKRSWDIFSVIATIISLILAFTGSIEDSNKWLIGIIISISFVIIFSVIYICEYVYNKFFLRRINAKIGKVSLVIKSGDLFEEEGIKVIPVNEYFDTQVDNDIISDTTLHGIFVKRYIGNNNEKLKKLNMEISKQLKDVNCIEVKERKRGKKKRYPIASTILIDDYILTALSKFNEKNEAYLSMPEYLEFLNKFWNEIDRIHNGRIINIPVIGTGLARINPTLSYEEYLEQIIFSLKTSSIIAGEAKINIIISEKKMKECSLVKLKNIVSTINNK